MTEEEEEVQAKSVSGNALPLLRKVDDEDEEEILQKKETFGSTSAVTPKLEANIRSLRTGGQQLPESVRAFYEPRFGYDLSNVRVHTGSHAAETAKSINARAFTLGNNISFSEGQFALESYEGRKLLAHELTHTIQQRATKFLPSVSLNMKAESILPEINGQGSPLSDSARNFMEAGFGIDFGHVRIHTNTSVVDLSKDPHAQAFTQGSDIYFKEGIYNPATADGLKLLTRELTHVVQENKSKGVPLSPARRKIVGKDALESVKPISAHHPSQLASSQAAPSAPAVAPEVPQAASPAKTPAVPLTRQETASGQPREKEEAPGMERSAVESAKAPAKPEEDRDFQQAKKSIRNDARKQKSHQPAGKKRDEMVAAAALKTDEQKLQSGQEQQAKNLEKAAAPKPFDRIKFKEKLKIKIQSKMPETEKDAKAFPGSGKLEQAKEEFKGTVSEEKGRVTGPLEQTAEQPLPKGQALKPDKIDVPRPIPADKPSKVKTGLAAPKPRTDEEISLQYRSDSLDEQMTQEGITEQQLAESEEPQFERALQSKKDAQREIAAAPAHYRQIEARKLADSQKRADKVIEKELNKMAAAKTTKTGEVFRGQTTREKKTEERQRQIKEQIGSIYTSTERDVRKILEDLSTGVGQTFSVRVEAANETFKNRVRSRLDDHYGWFTFDDKIAEWAGLSDGVRYIFDEEKANFLFTMDLVLDDIATTVETELNKALARIQKGRAELDGFKKTLNAEELQFAGDMLAEATDKFTELESGVNESQDELIETLSDQYVESLNKLEEEFDKIDEELGSSWITDAISFIKEVGSAIRKLGDLLTSIGERIADYVGAILAAPKKFFATLVSGINQGINKFTSNIGTYLKQGFWMWLTGASGARNIQIPEKMDPKGMFSLALQMLGIDKLFFLERIRVKLGKGVEKLITGAEAAGEKLLEPVRILLDGGVGALWEWVKAEVSSRLQEIFTKIKEEIFEAIIKKALAWVASLFIPGLGFIRLIQAIYKALRWLVDNISRIADLVNSFLDSVGLAVRGNASAIVDKVIKGLTLGIVIAIDFLAKLVGLGNFADKLQSAIQSLRKPIQKVIDWLLTKAKPVVRKLQRAMKKAAIGVKKVVKRGKRAVKAGVVKVLDWWRERRQMRLGDDKTHTLKFMRSGQSARLMLASKEKPVQEHLQEAIAGDELDDAEKARARDAFQFFNANIAPLISQPVPDNPPPVLQAKIVALPNNLNQLSAMLTAIGQDKAITLPEAEWDPKGPHISRVEQLSNRTSRGGQEASAGEPKGWNLIVRRGLTTSKGNWVRMHMITAGIGGQDVDGNLLPAPTAVNTGGIVRRFELQVERILYGDIPSSDVRAARSLFKRLKTRNAVIWVETTSQGFWPAYTDPADGKLLYDASTFATSVSFKAGMHFARNNNWAKDPTALVQAQVRIPQPDFTASYQPNINEIGEPMIVRLAGIKPDYAREIVAERGGTPAPRPFPGPTEFFIRMEQYRMDNNIRLTPEFDQALRFIVAKVGKGRAMKWSD